MEVMMNGIRNELIKETEEKIQLRLKVEGEDKRMVWQKKIKIKSKDIH